MSRLRKPSWLRGHPLEHWISGHDGMRAGDAEAVDGDTCYFSVDPGFYTYPYWPLRIDGVDTWESRQGPAAYRLRGELARRHLTALTLGRSFRVYVHEFDMSAQRFVARVEIVALDEAGVRSWDVAGLIQNTEHEKGAPLGMIGRSALKDAGLYLPEMEDPNYWRAA